MPSPVSSMLISYQGIPITDPHFWQSEDECTLDVLKQVFRSSTDEEMPLLEERLACLRESGQVLYEVFSLPCPLLVSHSNLYSSLFRRNTNAA